MLEVLCTGKYTQADLLGVVDAIAAARERDPGIKKFLIDALKAEIELGGIGEFFVGEYAAKKLIGTRISLLTAPGQVSKLLENAAYNRGLKFLSASRREEAEAWLAD
jgi:hypothetical protein